MYTIVYCENIKIFFGEMLLEQMPIGKYHTEEFRTKRERFKELGLKEKIDFFPIKQVFNESVRLTIVPRYYQDAVVTKTCSPGTLNGIVQSPTRSGKTNMIGMTIAKENKSSIILVDQVLLAKQIEKALVKLYGLDSEAKQRIIGVVADDRKEVGRPILICTWQSLQSRSIFNAIKSYGYNMLFGDEAHRASADVFSSIVQTYKAEKKFGFSASPYKTKKSQKEKLHDTFGPIIHKVPIEDLYSNGYLVRPEFYRIPTNYQVSIETGIRSYYNQKLSRSSSYRKIIGSESLKNPLYRDLMRGKTLKEIIYSPNEDIIEILTTVAVSNMINGVYSLENPEAIKIGIAKKGIDFNLERLKTIEEFSIATLKKENEKAVVAFNLVGACLHLYNKLKSHGYKNVLLITSKNKNVDELEKVMDGENKNYIILTTYQYFSEGLDIPTLEHIVAASPYYPPFCRIETAEQLSGRPITPDPENPNKKPIIYFIEDIAANVKTRGMKQRVDEILLESLHPSLNEGIKKEMYFSSRRDTHVIEAKIIQKKV